MVWSLWTCSILGIFFPVDSSIFSRFDIFLCFVKICFLMLLYDDSFCFNHTEKMGLRM
ncbi:hypothetical protein AtNW77_Chr5g0100611 [Arabidopsis thaliana]